MLPDKINHVEVGLSRLKQFRRKPIIQGLLESYLTKIQDAEDVAEFYKNLSIYNATGEDLNRIGRLFDVDRLGRDDEAYRRAILAFIASTSPECTVGGIISACKAYGNTDFVDLWEHFPAHVEIWMGDGWTPDMWSVVKTMVPAGVSARVLVDAGGDSIRFAEESPVSYTLTTEAGESEIYTLEDTAGDPKRLSVSALGDYFEFFPNQSQFAEEGDNEYNPFAEELFTQVLYSVGNISGDPPDVIVDEFGNNVIYTDFRFN